MRPARPARSRRQTLKDKKREETRARLIAAAKRLFTEYGYGDVSVTEIASEAGVTHSMINVYFGGKPGLLYEIVRENNEPQFEQSTWIASQERPALQRLSEMLLAWIRADASDPGLLAIMQSYSWVWPVETEVENAAERARFEDLIDTLLVEAVDAGEIPPLADASVTSRAIFAIYTWGLRAAVFEQASPEKCHAAIIEQVGMILRAPLTA